MSLCRRAGQLTWSGRLQRFNNIRNLSQCPIHCNRILSQSDRFCCNCVVIFENCYDCSFITTYGQYLTSSAEGNSFTISISIRALVLFIRMCYLSHKPCKTGLIPYTRVDSLTTIYSILQINAITNTYSDFQCIRPISDLSDFTQ